MAQTQEGYGIHGDPPPYTPAEEARMNYSRQYNSDLDPHDRPNSRHSSVSQAGDGRAAPEATRYAQPTKPIGEAVETAFDKAEINTNLHPDLIAQITQNVIQQLNINKATTDTKADYKPPPPQPQTTKVPHSPTSTQSGASPPPPMPRNVYTPPSPQKHGEYPINFGSPESRTSMHYETPTSPIKRAPEERRSSSGSNSSDGTRTRPRAPSRAPTAEETTLERIWGQLFDAEGRPTARLSQFLRGIAVHMIEEYEPKGSLVVTPEKMEKFYNDMRLPHEIYPWNVVFDDTQSSISRMYRSLECQHHLVQEGEHFDEKPDIPGLTPHGFQHWATLMIKAHPDDEFERLKKAALDLPINNPDDKKERFPKEISRRLFPSTPDLGIKGQLVQAIEKHCRVTIEKSSSSETSRAPPTNRAPSPQRSEASYTSDPPYAPSGIERERNPYSSQPSEGAIDDFSTKTSKPIERERKRKPYCAAPGGGLVYEDSNRPPTMSEARSANPPPRLYEDSNRPTPMPETRSPMPPPPSGPPPSGPPPGNVHRNSVASSRPINIPPPPPSQQQQQRQPDYMSESYHAGMQHRPSVSSRRRAPSPINDLGRRSEPDVRSGGFPPNSYAAPSVLDGEYEDDRRYRRPSPGRRFERADTIDPRDNRRSMYGTEEEWYRARSNTIGQSRNW